MDKDEAMRISKEALTELEELLAEGRPETLKRYLDQMAVFHKYSFLNVMMILAQNPNASHVAGFGTWKKLGRWVKADECGIGIFAPLIQRRTDRDDSAPESAQPPAAANQRVLAGFRVVHVFDLSQTEGEAMPELSKPLGEPGDALPHLFKFSEYSAIKVIEQEIPWGSTGVSRGGTILLRLGLSDSEKFSVLAHELAHEFLHQVSPEAKRTNRAQAEVEAESVAYVVSRAFGIDCRLPATEYIHVFLRDGKKDLTDQFERIRRTACRIILGVKAAKETADGCSSGQPHLSHAA